MLDTSRFTKGGYEKVSFIGDADGNAPHNRVNTFVLTTCPF